MENKTDEDHLDNTAIPDKDTGPVNPNQETENMEVHKHPHHVMHKKKWGEYVLEFSMLFLAVFLGFIAENIREDIVERHKEKEYIESLVKDLKTDTANLSLVITGYKTIAGMQDSLLHSFELIDKGGNKNFVRLMESLSGFPDFVYNDATIQQLKNSGGFRLLKNKKAVDSIISYTSDVTLAFINTTDLNGWLHDIKTDRSNFINYITLDKAKEKGFDLDQLQKQNMFLLISQDKVEKEKFYGKTRHYSEIMKLILNYNFIPLKLHAIRLIALLQKEYQLESE